MREPPPAVDSGRETYDVFISHASEDKDTIVRSLATELMARGLKVWYDEFTLRIGDSLRQKIDRGLAGSRVGLVVLSRSFVSKGWSNYELDGIVTRTVSGEQILLPIWHKITKQEVFDFSPSLADEVARSTGTHTVQEIATEIAELLGGSSACPLLPSPRLTVAVVGLATLLYKRLTDSLSLKMQAFDSWTEMTAAEADGFS